MFPPLCLALHAFPLRLNAPLHNLFVAHVVPRPLCNFTTLLREFLLLGKPLAMLSLSMGLFLLPKSYCCWAKLSHELILYFLNCPRTELTFSYISLISLSSQFYTQSMDNLFSFPISSISSPLRDSGSPSSPGHLWPSSSLSHSLMPSIFLPSHQPDRVVQPTKQDPSIPSLTPSQNPSLYSQSSTAIVPLSPTVLSQLYPAPLAKRHCCWIPSSPLCTDCTMPFLRITKNQNAFLLLFPGVCPCVVCLLIQPGFCVRGIIFWTGCYYM